MTNNASYAITLLNDYKKQLAPFLESYFEDKIKRAEKVDSLAIEALEIIREFVLAGGKRLRPVLVFYGYLAAGGQKNDEIIKTSISIELIHTFLLIHDDIIDRDEKRHGITTVHEKYKKIGKHFFAKSQTEAAHFGNSMAITAGDLAAALGNEVLFNANFQSEIIIKALRKLQEIVYITIPGEMLDIVLEAKGKATEQEVLRMYEGKTARYTFEGPLHLGAVLAGAKNEFLDQISKYAIPLGIAYQLRDDILGIFGNEKKLGKPVGSDIIEGKQTLLVIKALEKADRKQKSEIKKLLGKKDLTKDEIEDFRDLIKQTGALNYANNFLDQMIEKAVFALEKINIKDTETKNFLSGIAQYIKEREQ